MDKTQSFSSIKSDLLQALDKCHHQNLPTDPEDIIFGLPVDKHDLRKGWVALDEPVVNGEDDSGTKHDGKGQKGVLDSNPLGAGLKDRGVLAFKFRNTDEVSENGTSIDDTKWDVAIPSYEDENASQK